MSRLFQVWILLLSLSPVLAWSQTGKGVIRGDVKDAQGASLQGASVTLQPQIRPITTDGQGAFTITEVPAGSYTVTISYLGFAPYSATVEVVAGQAAHLSAVLKVASISDEVVVTAERAFGEAEAINRTRAAENILQVLPAEVITSLPNANIADALGRMASVTIERDEGEGKYVQIRGTEPRLNNTMIDGVTVPSPETGVRQIKLDTIASDLVESVEINKTLQANIDADGIGGSVNLVTKTAGDAPAMGFYGIGGYTPILGGRDVYQYGGTLSKRVGPAKKLGLLIGGTYDYNGRGINDIEPDPQPNPNNTTSPYYDEMDIRDYVYYRTRWGLAGSADYKLSDRSTIALRGLYSTFRNWGHKFVFSLNDGDVPKYSQDWRRPDMAVGSLSLQGKHLINANTFNWSAAVSRSRSLNGSGSAKYSWVGDNAIACNYDPSAATSVYRPGWSAGCFGTGADNAVDSGNYKLKSFAPPTFGQSVQLNLQASGSYSRLYHFGNRFGTFELGGKVRNEHKFDDTYDESFTPNSTMLVSAHPEWDSDFTDPDYYDKTYHIGPVTDYSKLQSYVNSNSTLFSQSGGPGANDNNYDLIERVSSGYAMNTIELNNRLRLVTGLRFEATHVDTLSFSDTTNKMDFKNGGDYLDVLPSASLRVLIDADSNLRLVYGRGLSRPDPQDITTAVSQPVIGGKYTQVSAGNPDLKPEHANNFDVLYERYLPHTGLLQAGYFYKDLSDPIVDGYQYPTSGPLAGDKVSTKVNAGSASVQGIEIGFQQRFAYLPGAMKGLGLSANYSYTTSKANGLPGRSDSPAMLRDAPNSWNVSPTFDTKRFSMRLGVTFDDAMIYAYQWADGADPIGGVKGPLGDNYLYAHLQVDTQASYRLPRGFEVYAYGLNLNNEVFGFYNGSTQYVVQREYYHPTFAGGLRWNPRFEKK